MDKFFYVIVKNDYVNPVMYLTSAPSTNNGMTENTEWSEDIFDAYQFAEASDTDFLHAFDQAKADYPNMDIRSKMVKITAVIL